MSIIKPINCQQGVFQYCSYGYDKTKYSSRFDCEQAEMKKCPESSPVISVVPCLKTLLIEPLLGSMLALVPRETQKYEVINDFRGQIMTGGQSTTMQVRMFKFKQGQVIDGGHYRNCSNNRKETWLVFNVDNQNVRIPVVGSEKLIKPITSINTRSDQTAQNNNKAKSMKLQIVIGVLLVITLIMLIRE